MTVAMNEPVAEYVCDPETVPPPGLLVTVAGPLDPSPQSIWAVCVSQAPLSVNVACCVTWVPTISVRSAPAETTGATLPSVRTRLSETTGFTPSFPCSRIVQEPPSLQVTFVARALGALKAQV